ncbi:helix-turn-helix domain-containing protein [Chitinophaga filiformis]|uniref:Helix-turn-helix domain-containing protein n=1 Tax=Chitinophaga filiformis TaxID=104663 RepID=A0ABY4HT96_CHIFI|nr:helix-turn-helix domain-containing protein [Chitinophaga filiformis]UPK67009.1 helix-turn-helix domain-containing protein [Chitinophaga filiformis]
MERKVVKVRTISELHRLYNCGAPKHPLVSVIDLMSIDHNVLDPGVGYQMDLYLVSCKRFKGEIMYGRSPYDFEEGSVMFTSPGQVLSVAQEVKMAEGWALFFHPDLINGSSLGRLIHQYSFFLYDLNEALHVSEEEKAILYDSVSKIERECAGRIDKHTQHLIVSNIELLLSYCERFYDRQFLTRQKVNNDIVQQFEFLLNEYFTRDILQQDGLPDVKYFASKLNLSAKYLADLLQKFTGKSTQEHIHLRLVQEAKNLLWGTNRSISEISYNLGFEHASHFSRLFKTKTGLTPGEFRNNRQEPDVTG